jgi:hypothetical protein
MKRILALFLLSASTLFAQSPSSALFKWGYTYSSAYPVACSATVTANCIQSFILTQGDTVVATIPATSAASYNYTLNSLPTPGTYTYSLVAVGAYQGGTINSLPATVSLQVPGQPSTPGTFTVVLQ